MSFWGQWCRYVCMYSFLPHLHIVQWPKCTCNRDPYIQITRPICTYKQRDLCKYKQRDLYVCAYKQRDLCMQYIPIHIHVYMYDITFFAWIYVNTSKETYMYIQTKRLISLSGLFVGIYIHACKKCLHEKNVQMYMQYIPIHLHYELLRTMMSVCLYV